jgi:hypothetical protein
MKVLCVSNTYVGLSITIGKWYEVRNGYWKYDNEFINSNASSECFIVKDDKERWTVLNQTYFKTIEDIRDEKLKEIGI